jgi:hypothetical protein
MIMKNLVVWLNDWEVNAVPDHRGYKKDVSLCFPGVFILRGGCTPGGMLGVLLIKDV